MESTSFIEADFAINQASKPIEICGKAARVNYALGLSDSVGFAQDVTNIVFDSETGVYRPELFDFACNIIMLTRYTNIILPEDVGTRFVILHQTRLCAEVKQQIDREQFADLCQAAEKKIAYLVGCAQAMHGEKFAELMRSMEQLAGIANTFSGMEEGQLQAMVANLANIDQYGSVLNSDIKNAHDAAGSAMRKYLNDFSIGFEKAMFSVLAKTGDLVAAFQYKTPGWKGFYAGNLLTLLFGSLGVVGDGIKNIVSSILDGAKDIMPNLLNLLKLVIDNILPVAAAALAPSAISPHDAVALTTSAISQHDAMQVQDATLLAAIKDLNPESLYPAASRVMPLISTTMYNPAAGLQSFGDVTIDAPVSVVINHNGNLDAPAADEFGQRIAAVTANNLIDVFRQKGIRGALSNTALGPRP